ncbi:MAG: hypothetical protein JJ892_00720 [Balneola sp.]|nr:hypothetical protein [Balneola sp.]MBO6650807.1 hypothetical protein [Balneola sp.]MBO6710084.1 hypothetical protein [Balneola sp.]MBO6798768.1 hypothetical protein [Balneola sp.]MBO6869882.1 hypothetical protein [Balneola sp.]
MSKYRLLTFYWLIPMYLFFLVSQQAMVYVGAKDTVEEGIQYEADVLDMEVKQIAAQSNGYIVIAFETNSGTRIERKMTLSIQMAQKLLESSKVKLSYRKGGYPEIVLLPTYELQVKTSLFNGAVAFLGLIVTLIAGVRVQKYINRKSADETGDDFNIERVDS